MSARTVIVFADGRLRTDLTGRGAEIILLDRGVERRFRLCGHARNKSTRFDGLVLEGGRFEDANDGAVVYVETSGE